MTLRDNPRIDNASSLDRPALGSPISPSDTAIANYAGRELQPNRGVPLNLDWVEAVRVNTSAVERRTQTIGTRRTVKKEWQAAWHSFFTVRRVPMVCVRRSTALVFTRTASTQSKFNGTPRLGWSSRPA